MSQKQNQTLVLFLTLVITGGLLGFGYWWFTRSSGDTISKGNQTSSSPGETLPPPPSPGVASGFPPPTNVPRGTTVKIDGSTSMVKINQTLKNGFELQFPGAKVLTNATGSDRGIQDLLSGMIDVAALSRPLTPQEQAKGLVAIPITQDAIAIVVGNNNPYRKGLTEEQVRGIFQGKITNWSEVGGTPGPIRVLNRPAISGTHQAFRELVLKGADFGTTPNIITMQRDATTPILRELGTDGISYGTYSQISDQRTVRTVAVSGLTPEAPTYPYQRTLYYVYKEPANPGVQAFLGYATSPLGQQIINKQ